MHSDWPMTQIEFIGFDSAQQTKWLTTRGRHSMFVMIMKKKEEFVFVSVAVV
jgi:hypothetical protein